MNKVIPIVTQNVDRVIRRRDYEEKLESNQLLVTSMFRTIQGEGPYAGHPAVFLRLAGCNFGDKQDHCAWCDTSFQFDQGKVYDYHDLLMALMSLEGYRHSDILVITGGEPTLQPGLLNFIIGLGDDVFKRVQIETNGTQASFFRDLDRYEEEASDDYVRPSVVISPKASTAAGRTPALSNSVLQYASCLKFVVSADSNDPQHTIPNWAFEVQKQWPHCQIYVSPMAVYLKPYAGEVSSVWDASLINQEATAANYAYAAAYAMKHGLLLSLQTHLFTAVP